MKSCLAALPKSLRNCILNAVRLLFVLGIVFLIGTPQTKATHMIGGEFSYTCVNSCTIRVEAVEYRRCFETAMLVPNINIYPATPGCVLPTTIGNMSTPVITELVPICPFITTSCNTQNSSFQGIEEFRAEVFYDLCNSYGCKFNLTWTSASRTPFTPSLVNPTSESYFYQTELDLTTPGICNSPPSFTASPNPYYCTRQSLTFSQAAIDPDGDSLSYELSPCMSSFQTPVAYAAGYSATQPLGPSWDITIDPVTGLVNLIAVPGNVIKAPVCIVVKEWHNGVHVNSVFRDIVFYMIDCPTVCGANLIEGNVHLDGNGNCSLDPGELQLENVLIKVNGGSSGIMQTDSAGYFKGYFPPGTYVIEPILPNNGLWVSNCPLIGSYTVTFPGVNGVSSNNDFGYMSTSICPYLNVMIGGNGPRPCNSFFLNVRAENTGTQAVYSSIVEVDFGPSFVYSNLLPSPGISFLSNTGSTARFSIDTLDIFEVRNFTLRAQLPCSSIYSGNTECIEARIYPDSLCQAPNPLWDQSHLVLTAGCFGDSLTCFTVSNTGSPATGNMLGATNWRLLENNVQIQTGTVQLCGGCDTTFCFPANGNTFRFEVNQRPFHPGFSHPSKVIERCGSPNDAIYLVLSHPLDDLDHFIDIACFEIARPYDPNAKYAIPTGVTAGRNYIDSTTSLHYHIDFQNLGNGSAIDVWIEDVLDPHLDLLTIQPGVSSHPYRFEVLQNRKMRFIFDNIMLPPASQDSSGSKGFVEFDVAQVPGNTFQDVIYNKADIFFDLNLPIQTNLVYHTIGWPVVPVQIELPSIQGNVKVWPNPTENEAYVQVEGIDALNPVRVELFSTIGQRVYSGEFKAGEVYRLDLKSLARGIYIYQLYQNGMTLKSGKIMLKN